MIPALPRTSRARAARANVLRVARAAAAPLLLALAWLAAPGPALAAAPPRTIELADCRLPHPAGLGSVPARCGTYVVPEDYGAPQGRRLSLRVAVVPALDRGSDVAPLFIVSGGPGQAATTFYAAYAGAFQRVGRTRDLVLLDQRGTGGSNALRCEFPEDFETGSPSLELVRRMSAECRAALPGDPRFYTTSVAVRDLDAVRAALGYPKIALYGVSYGTRVVQHYARRHAAHVHAVVLDGVIAPDLPLATQTPFDAQRALDLMFARCAREAPCATAFPDLARRFDELRGRLAAAPERVAVPDPHTGQTRELDFGAEQLVGAVRLLNYQSTTTALLPLLLDRAAKGNLVPLAAQLLMIGSTLEDQLAYGMNAAVICTEDVPFVGAIDRDRLARTYFGATQLDGLKALCEGWPPGAMDADLRAPLRSTVPALLLSGEADPVTPPSSAERAAKGFADALHVVVPGQGHGQMTGLCAARVVNAFLDAGTAKGLDVACLAKGAPAPFFVDAVGPTP